MGPPPPSTSLTPALLVWKKNVLFFAYYDILSFCFFKKHEVMLYFDYMAVSLCIMYAIGAL